MGDTDTDLTNACRHGDAIADLYDQICFYDDEVDDAVALLTRLSPESGSVLELGVGTGRLAVPLARAGRRVHGVDAAERMLDECRRKDPDGTVRLSRGDFASHVVGETFDLVLLALNSLLYLTDQDRQVQCLANVREHLKERGRAVFDLYEPTAVHAIDGQKTTVVPLGRESTLVISGAVSKSRQILQVNQALIGGGTVRNVDEVQRYCWPSQLDLMARMAGLCLLARWSDWRRTPFGEGSTRHISVYEAA